MPSIFPPTSGIPTVMSRSTVSVVVPPDSLSLIVPTMLPAFTDSRTFRAAFPECVAYGFFPQREMNLYETSPLVHSRDERIATADLGFAARCYRDVAKELLGA